MSLLVPDPPVSVPRDTRTINRRRQDFAGVDSVWLFGYGSLLYKANFAWLERCEATLEGYARRLWQGSHDHRGTPDRPGRVATLVADPHARCVGMAYRVTPATFVALDLREKNGYLRERATFTLAGGRRAAGVTYIAPAGNAAWLGPASDIDIAQRVAVASGPSGRNSDYVLRLAAALHELGADDPHIAAIATLLRTRFGVPDGSVPRRWP